MQSKGEKTGQSLNPQRDGRDSDDVFADLIPGIFFLYIINQAFAVYKLPSIDITQLDKFYNLLLVGMIAYILGHIINNPVAMLYNGMLRDRAKRQVLRRLKNKHPEFNIQFKRKDSGILYAVIEHLDLNIAQTIDVFRANWVMMRNISAGLLFYSLLQVLLIVQTGLLYPYLLMAIIGIVLTISALTRTWRFEIMFYQSVYHSALNYGTSLEEVLRRSQKLTAGGAEKPTRHIRKKLVRVGNGRRGGLPQSDKERED